jgi:hypothetical protein
VRAASQLLARGGGVDLGGHDRDHRGAEHVEVGLHQLDQVEPVALAQRRRRDEHVGAPLPAQRERLRGAAGVDRMMAGGAQRAAEPAPGRRGLVCDQYEHSGHAAHGKPVQRWGS